MATKSVNLDPKRTTIALSVAMALVIAAVTLSTRFAKVEAQVEQNKTDIYSLNQKIDDLNKNLTETNNSVIELNATLKSLTGQLTAADSPVVIQETPDNNTNITIKPDKQSDEQPNRSLLDILPL